MKSITNYLTYVNGDEIKPNNLYVGGDIIPCTGSVEFTVFGSVLMDGIRLVSRTYHLYFENIVNFQIEKDSGIMFQKATAIKKRAMFEEMPVPDVPDMLDSETLQLHALFDEWAQKQGLKLQDRESLISEEGEEIFDGDIDDDDEMDTYIEDRLDILHDVPYHSPPLVDEDVNIVPPEEQIDEKVKDPPEE